MKLKFKELDLEAGRPIAFVSGKFAERYHITEGGRVEVLFNSKKLIMIANLIDGFISEGEVSFSNEAVEYLKIKKGCEVDVSVAIEPKSTQFILKKLNGKRLSEKEIYQIIYDITTNSLNEAEIAFFVSGVYNSGMSFEETAFLTKAIAETGNVLSWETERIADKHSIGGIPGNRTTPIVVAICAAAGILIPKTSSRAITSAAGTADVMEVLANVELSSEELKETVMKTNGCFVWGGSLGFAPADDKIIRVERLLNIDPESQLLASIIAKKLAAGSKFVLIDIPYGKGAKVSFSEARKLKEKFLKLGKYFSLKIEVVLTDGCQPIGNGIGPVLEARDVLRVLERKNYPMDLENKCIFLASKLLENSKIAKRGEGKKLAKEILDSKRALKKFWEIVEAQGKKNTRLNIGKFSHFFRAEKGFVVRRIDNKKIALLARILGCPSDKSAGIYLEKHIGNRVKKGEKLFEVYSSSKKKLDEGINFVGKNGIIL